MNIPSIIWTFWEETNLPPHVEKCIESWRRTCASRFEIIILNRLNYHHYVPDIDLYKLNVIQPLEGSTRATRVSDFLRIYLLRHYGGLWMDASIFCFESLAPLLDDSAFSGCEFVGFQIPNFNTDARFPIIENWSFASVAHGRFIDEWFEEALYMDRRFGNLDRYVDVMREDGIDTQNIGTPHYLAYHVAVQHVLQRCQARHPDIKPVDYYRMYLFNATGENSHPLFAKGPFYFLNANDWDSDRAVKAVKNEREKYASAFIKLRGSDRGAFKDWD